MEAKETHKKRIELKKKHKKDWNKSHWGNWHTRPGRQTKGRGRH